MKRDIVPRARLRAQKRVSCSRSEVASEEISRVFAHMSRSDTPIGLVVHNGSVRL
jgi:hypothetical protein